MNPGIFFKICIGYSKEEVFNFTDINSWVKFPTELQKYNQIKNPYFLYLDIGEGNKVLILQGFRYGCDYGGGFITIILLEESSPKIVFNKQCIIRKIIRNGASCKFRVSFGGFEYGGDMKEDRKGRTIPYGLESMRICDIYVKNNELIVEDLHLTVEQIMDLVV